MNHTLEEAASPHAWMLTFLLKQKQKNPTTTDGLEGRGAIMLTSPVNQCRTYEKKAVRFFT